MEQPNALTKLVQEKLTSIDVDTQKTQKAIEKAHKTHQTEIGKLTKHLEDNEVQKKELEGILNNKQKPN